MKSIVRRFNYMKGKFGDSDDYANFERAVDDQGFTRKAISLAFNKLVGNDKCDNRVKTKLLDRVERQKNCVYDGHLEAKSRPGDEQKSKRYQNSLHKDKAVKRREIRYCIKKNSDGTYDVWLGDRQIMHGFESKFWAKYHIDTKHPLWIQVEE